MERTYHVYILSSRSRVLYTGVTNELIRRLGEHRDGTASKFTAKYRIHRLVYWEAYGSIRAAIAREKQMKNWTREEKVVLIESTNPTWTDLAADWFSPYPRKAGPSASLGMTGLGPGLKIQRAAVQQNAVVGVAKTAPRRKLNAQT